MFPFAPRLLRTFTATHLGNESARRQGADRSALRRVYAAIEHDPARRYAESPPQQCRSVPDYDSCNSILVTPHRSSLGDRHVQASAACFILDEANLAPGCDLAA